MCFLHHCFLDFPEGRGHYRIVYFVYRSAGDTCTGMSVESVNEILIIRSRHSRGRVLNAILLSNRRVSLYGRIRAYLHVSFVSICYDTWTTHLSVSATIRSRFDSGNLAVFAFLTRLLFIIMAVEIVRVLLKRWSIISISHLHRWTCRIFSLLFSTLYGPV